MNNGSANNAIYLWGTGISSNGMPVFKVGHTSTRRGDKRIQIVAKRWGFTPKTIRLEETSAPATSVERLLIRIGQAADMSPFVGYRTDGKTEFRTMTDGELTEAIAIIDAHTKQRDK
ncbi:MAG: hypothetical protein K2Q15_07360 [Burkholderiales bacterium]|nr:hypothetical protein [Candidatus Obscuribacterales bacterium]MBY0445007.1 hypothetical protein [Burkholderiales bacterium]